MAIPKTIVPNTFTALNLLCGFLAIIFAAEMNLLESALLIIAASLFDAVDGLFARALKVSSKFGVELDSLSDVVSFGAAPAFLVYISYTHQFNWMGMIIASAPLLFGAFRLARFNVNVGDLTKKEDFTGLPIPVAAISIASFIIAFNVDGKFIWHSEYALIPLVLLVSFLMVSKVRYNKMPKLNKNSLRESKVYIVIILTGIVLGLFTKDLALFAIFFLIILSGLFRHLFLILKR